MRLIARDLKQNINKEVSAQGWVHAVRILGNLAFLQVRDRSGVFQVVVTNKKLIELLKNLQVGSVVGIKAKVSQNEQAELGVELVDPEIVVISEVKEPMPIEINKDEIPAHLETILDFRPLTLRNRKIAAVFKIQSEIMRVYRDYMLNEVDATEYFGPSIIGASSEGGSEFFNIDYFDTRATLAQSNQLYKQMMVGVYERVFALQPFYRAENSNTVRHLTEGKQLEFEMGFFNDWTEIMDVEEGFIKKLVKHLSTHNTQELKIIGTELISAPENIKFPRISLKEALEIYYQRTGIDERKEIDLSPAAEKELCAYAKEKFGTDLIFITDWSTEKRPFYSYPNEINPELTNTFDLLCAGTEVTSGGQRRHTYESMVEGIKMKGMDPDNFTDYLSIFKFGMPPHGGFGLGLERLTMTILRLSNIREATLFPSDTKRIAGVRIAKKVFTGTGVHEEIIKRLEQKKMNYQLIEHEATPTSEDSARVRKTKMSEGIKALILVSKKDKDKRIMACIPSNEKLDIKVIEARELDKFSFETPENIKNLFGLEVGSIPPFGNLLGLKTYFANSINNEAKAAFNCGYTTKSLVMKSNDLIDLVVPEWFDN